MSRGKKGTVPLEQQLVMAVIDKIRIQANKRAIALRRQAREYWNDARRYQRLQKEAVAATDFANFIATLQDPDAFVYVAGARDPKIGVVKEDP